MKNVIKIMGEITEYTFQTTLSSVLDIIKEDSTEKIIVLINSTGGASVEANAIIDLLESLPNEIVTVNLGKAFSAASLIFIHGKKRYMAKHATFMLHAAATTFEKSSLDINSIENESIKLKKVNALLKDFYTEKTQIPQDILENALSSTLGVTLSTEECIKYGVATDIITDLRSLFLPF